MKTLILIFSLVFTISCGKSPANNVVSDNETAEAELNRSFSVAGTTYNFELVTEPVLTQGTDRQADLLIRDSADQLMDLPPSWNLTALTWMPQEGHMHGSTATIQRVSEGHYRIEEMYFFMPGDWEVRIFFFEGGDRDYFHRVIFNVNVQ